MSIKKIRILEVTKNLNIGGAARTSQEFAINISKTEFDVLVGAYDISGPRRIILEENNIRTIKITNKTLHEIILQYQIDIVHSHQIDVSPFIGNALNIHTVVFREGFSETADLNLIKSKTLALKIAMDKKLVYGKNFLILGNPVNVESWEKFHLTRNEISKKRKSLGISSDDIVVGRLGRAEPAKIDYLLLESIPLIIRKNPNVKFLLFGLPRLYEFYLRKNSSLKGKVTFITPTSNDRQIAEFYQIIDIFWHTASRGETFGNTIVEAMLFKKPVITHSTHFKKSFLPPNHFFKFVGSLDVDNAQIELVDQMKTGLVANYPHDVVESIRYLCDNPSVMKKFGANGYDRVMASFEAKIVVKTFENIIKSLMNAKIFNVRPSKSELIYFFKKGYWAKIENRVKVEKWHEIFLFELKKLCFLFFLQFPYLVIRFILKRYFKKDYEKGKIIKCL